MQFKPRLYQETIVGTATLHNTLVVLPTGLGKTHIAIMLAQIRIKQYPTSKILVLAPTKPLVHQHQKTFSEHLPDAESLGTTIDGTISPEKRTKEFERATYIFSTPQTIENDLLSGRIKLQEVSLLVIDEAHRATGDYAYTYVTKQYKKQSKQERILGLTASPGSKEETIQEIIDHLGIERIEARTHEDPDVKPYVQEINIDYKEVELPPEFKALIILTKRLINNKLTLVQQSGYIKHIELNKTQLLAAQRTIQAEIKGGNPDPRVWRSISILAEVLKTQHALELLETQGISSLTTYLEGLQRQAEKGQSKAVKNLVEEPEFKALLHKSRGLNERGVEHPKLPTLISIVNLALTKKPDSKFIVFSQYRDQASNIVKKFGNKAQLFVGQQKKRDTGLTQKEQKAMIQSFREGEFPILVATQVGEEGLDIPSVDYVLFYEPIPSAIRTIQRRGRTGRHDTGKVTILVAKGTRDEGYRWSAHHKEKRMHRTIQTLNKNITPTPTNNKSVLHDYEEKTSINIVADTREKSSGILKELQELGVDLTLQPLQVGDYLLSKRVCVEFKTSKDFVDSILDGRLLGQLRELNKYQKPLVIIQGSDWYTQRNVHPNAIRGALSAITVSFGIPLLISQNEKDTANILFTIARRETEGGIGNPEYYGKTASTPKEELLQVIAMLPNIGPVLAPKLLDRFGSLKDLVNASTDELSQVEGIGKKKAETLHETFNRKE